MQRDDEKEEAPLPLREHTFLRVGVGPTARTRPPPNSPAFGPGPGPGPPGIREKRAKIKCNYCPEVPL